MEVVTQRIDQARGCEGTPHLRLGVLGCADIALRRILPALARVTGLTLVAVASRDRAKAGEVASQYGCAAAAGYAALLRQDNVDAVYVPVPTALHAEWAEAALIAGKHVLVEKPMATSRADTERLLALAATRGLVLMENVMFIHHSQHATVRRLVGEGVIGEPRLLEAAFLVPRVGADNVRWRGDLGGGALRELGVYPVRAALHLLGSELEVVGAVRTASATGIDTAGAAIMRTLGGVCAQLTFGIDHAYYSGYRLTGSEGRIGLDRAFTPPADHRPVLRIADRAGNERRHLLAADDQVGNTLAAFAHAASTGTDPPGTDQLVRQAALLDALSSYPFAGREPPPASAAPQSSPVRTVGE